MSHCLIDPSPDPPRADSLARLKETLELVAGVCEAEQVRMGVHGLSPNTQEVVAQHVESAGRRLRRALALLASEKLARSAELYSRALGDALPRRPG